MSDRTLCLYLPHAAASLYFDDPTHPGAILEDDRIVSVTPGANARGITAGMPLRVARAHIPELAVAAADDRREADWLSLVAARLSGRVEVFHAETPLFDNDARLISLAWPDEYTAEDVERLVRDLMPKGQTLKAGLGATKELALVAAQTGHPFVTRNTLRALMLSDACLQLSTRFPKTFADLFDAPAATLPESLLNYRRYLRGESEGFTQIHTPDVFQAEVTLSHPTGDALRIAHALHDAIRAATGWLQARRTTRARFTLSVTGTHGTMPLSLPLSLDTSDDTLMTDLLCRTALPGCIRTVRLQYDAPEGDEPQPSPASLAGRLQAKLGRGRVFMMSGLEQDLPSSSVRRSPVADPHARVGLEAVDALPGLRPTFLLSSPIALHAEEGRPTWERNGLTLVNGPERHESAREVRDYYIAQSDDGRRVWIYRRHDPYNDNRRWYLHGLFA